MIRIPDIECAFPVSLQFSANTDYAATLTLRARAWWRDYADHEWGDPPDERPWHVSLSMRLDGLPLVTWGAWLDKAEFGTSEDHETADGAVTARNRAFLKALDALYRAGYITAEQLDEAIMGAPGGPDVLGEGEQ